MRRLAFLLPVLAVVLAACPATKPGNNGAPDVAFSGFTNAGTGISIAANSTSLPTSFIAGIRASDAGQVIKTQCYLDGALLNGQSGGYQSSCQYAAVSGGTHTLKVDATNDSGVTTSVSKIVTVVTGAPTLASGTVNNAAINFATPSPSVAVPLDTSVTFTLHATSGGAPLVLTYLQVNGKLAASSNTADLSFTSPPVSVVTNVTLGALDTAGNHTEFGMVLAPQSASTGDQSPPVVNVTTPASSATVTGVITVAVTATHSSGIKGVTLLANNNPVGSPSSTTPYTFTVDTTKYANGPLTLAAVAVSGNGVSQTSGVVNVTVSNVLPPLLAITDPVNGASLKGAQTVTLSVQKQSSDFTFGSPITVTLSDYRGANSLSKTVTPSSNTSGVYTTAAFDLSNLPNDNYSITATATVNVVGVATPLTLQSIVSVTTKNTSLQPPAVIITNPVRVISDESITPIFGNAGFGYVFANISDNTGVASVELRMTCDTCVGGPVNALEQYIAYPTPAISASPVLQFDMDGTPYLPNGNYTARVVAQDVDGNRNIQEIKLRLDRSKHALGLYPITFAKGPDNTGAKLSPGSGAYSIGGLTQTDSYRVGEVVVDPKGGVAVGQSVFSGQTTETFGASFNVDGSWYFYSQVQDLNPLNPLVVPTTRVVQIVNKLP